MTPLKPEHGDSVNAITSIGGNLASGCKKYIVRVWDNKSTKFSEVNGSGTLCGLQSTF